MHSLFDPDRPKQVSLGTLLATEEVASILSLLREFADVFAWLHADTPGILPELVEHRLSVRESCRSIRQRLRRFHPIKQELIKQEVDKLLEVGFIKETQYRNGSPTWLLFLKRTASGECAWIIPI